MMKVCSGQWPETVWQSDRVETTHSKYLSGILSTGRVSIARYGKLPHTYSAHDTPTNQKGNRLTSVSLPDA